MFTKLTLRGKNVQWSSKLCIYLRICYTGDSICKIRSEFKHE